MAKYVLEFDSENCKGCGLCVAYCPKKILEIDNSVVNAKGYRTRRSPTWMSAWAARAA